MINNKKRKIIWNNPPYSANVKTNIGKTFLDFSRKDFLKTNELHKIFNKNAVKISFSYMSNISVIQGYNKNLLNPTVTQYGCNCQIREYYPLQILFIELISISGKTKSISFILGQHKLFLKKYSGITTEISIISNILKAQNYPNTSGC